MNPEKPWGQITGDLSTPPPLHPQGGPSEAWTYSPYRATLYFEGKPFCIATPDGQNALAEATVKKLLGDLNSTAAAVARSVAEAETPTCTRCQSGDFPLFCYGCADAILGKDMQSTIGLLCQAQADLATARTELEQAKEEQMRLRRCALVFEECADTWKQKNITLLARAEVAEAALLAAERQLADEVKRGHGVEAAVLNWWSDHEYDSADGGEDGEKNVYDEPPEFVAVAQAHRAAREAKK